MDLAGERVVGNADHGGHPVALDVPSEPFDDRSGRRVVECVGAESASELRHRDRRLDPATCDISDGALEDPVRAPDDVVPVAADLGVDRPRPVVRAERQAFGLRQRLRKQTLLQENSEVVLVLVSPDSPECLGGLVDVCLEKRMSVARQPSLAREQERCGTLLGILRVRERYRVEQPAPARYDSDPRKGIDLGRRLQVQRRRGCDELVGDPATHALVETTERRAATVNDRRQSSSDRSPPSRLTSTVASGNSDARAVATISRTWLPLSAWLRSCVS